MSKPEDIPQSVWEAGIAAVGYRRQPSSSSGLYLVRNVARAILAERERCVVAATEQTFDEHEIAQASDYGRGMDHAARTILAAIRMGGQ